MSDATSPEICPNLVKWEEDYREGRDGKLDNIIKREKRKKKIWKQWIEGRVEKSQSHLERLFLYKEDVYKCVLILNDRNVQPILVINLQ